MADMWVRPEFKGSKLVTPAEFGEARGMETTAMASRMRRYADKAPQVVRVVNNRTRYYLESELEDFLEKTSGNAPRSPYEVAYAEVVHLEQSIAEGVIGLANHDASVIKSEENLRKAAEALRKKKAARRKAAEALTRRRKELDIVRARMNLVSE